ncbi:hypothetical protein [Pontibacter ramchanderi]|uniref:Outer membrane protein with beta-barrel domain n=1 Tax=Pontibacter ramchanderi TaxID=1179743 RepID=A0A2N3V2N0_9BACT|nr:hypothetical protein [Pontibacter ramchanderi]PKV75863.1 hypothetical protein BD749_0810 [Pontibacter ramchanderi]
MKKTVAALVCFCSAYAAQGQVPPDSLKNRAYGSYVFLPVEFPIIDNRGFENAVTEADLPGGKHPTATLGLGLQFYANRYISTIAFAIGSRKKEEETYLTEMDYNSFSFNFGYDLTKNHRYALYPYLGYKGNGLNYLYREKIAKSTDMEEYLETDLRYKELHHSRAHLDLGFSFARQAFYLINARVGYLVPLEKSRWTINEDLHLSAAPGTRYKFYFSLNIGLGTIFSEDEMRRRHAR